MLETEDGRKVLTFPKCLGILLGVAQGLNFLHTGNRFDPNRSSVEKYTAFHRDIKSANICITSTFGAKLIDCGLGNLVEYIVESVLDIPGGRFGAPAYRDPGYADEEYEYGSFCDVFSFGVVMAEVFTGTLSAVGRTPGSAGGKASDTRTIHRKYVHVSRRRRELREDVDDLITDASETLLDQLSSMSLACMDEEPDERPSAYDIMARLQEMMIKGRCGDTWTKSDSGITAGARVPGGKRCCICQKQERLCLSCSDDHYVCAEHLPSHEGIARGQDLLECMLEGCSKCYQEDDVNKCLPVDMYKAYDHRRALNAAYLRTFAKMYPKDKFLNRLDDKIDVALEGLQYLNKNAHRALVAFAHLVAGVQTPCPKLVWIVPQKRTVRGGSKGMKDAFFRETAVYFFCENTYTKGHDDALKMNFGRKWVKHLLPLMKLSLLTLKMTGAGTLGLPFLLPEVVKSSEQFEYLEDLIRGILLEDESLQSMQETLQDMEAWFYDIVKMGISRMEIERVARIKRLMSTSYEMLSQTALNETNLPKWQTSMKTEIMYDGIGRKCKIKWIKM